MSEIQEAVRRLIRGEAVRVYRIHPQLVALWVANHERNVRDGFYKPWEGIRYYGRSPSACRVYSPVAARTLELRDELHFFGVMYLERLGVSQLYETVPLLPREATGVTARELGLTCPRYRDSDEERILTTSLVATRYEAGGQAQQLAIETRYAGEVAGRCRKAVRCDLAIQQAYWIARGATWRLLTDLDLPAQRYRNLAWLRLPWLLTRGEWPQAELHRYAARFCVAWAQDLSLGQILDRLAARHGGTRQQQFGGFACAVWADALRLDLEQERLNLKRPIRFAQRDGR